MKISVYKTPEDYQREKKIIIKPETEKQKRLWKEALPELKNIEALLCQFGIKEDWFEVIIGLDHLKEWSFPTKMPHIEGIERMKNLERLRIFSSPKLENISPIGKMVHLKELGLELAKITNYSALATLTNLEKLYLDGGMYRYQNLDNIHFVKEMKKLTLLSLTSTRMTDKNFDAITHLTALEELRISLNYPAEEFEKLRVLPHLKRCNAFHIIHDDIFYPYQNQS